MANKKNKVKFGLQNVYWAKINEWGEDPDGNKTVPAYGPSKHLPGAVSLSIDANGEAENFFADNGVYYVINNNAGYTGDLEIALITTEFATEILGEILDNNGVLVEKNDTELAQFALMFEFLGDKHHIRCIITGSRCRITLIRPLNLLQSHLKEVLLWLFRKILQLTELKCLLRQVLLYHACIV